MKHIYSWINGLDGGKKRSTLERLRKEAVRDHKNVRLGGEGGLSEAEGSIGQSYGHQAQAAIQGYAQNILPFGVGRSPAFSPGYGGGNEGGGFPNIPAISSQLPNVFGVSGFANREGPGDALPQPSHYAPSYAPAQSSHHEQYRSALPEPTLDQSSTYAPPYAPPHAPNYPRQSEGGYQPSYDQTPPQFGFSGGYGNVGGESGSGFGHGWPSEPQPQPQEEGTQSNTWQGDHQYGFSGGFPNPERRFGF